MSLKPAQVRYLRGLAHDRRPIVLVGQAGASDAVIAEINQALDDHELLKVRLSVGDREARDEAIQTICTRTGAERIQRIGHTLVLFRANPDKRKVELPR